MSLDGIRGVVEEFDEHRGVGRIRRDDGTPYDFHCVDIADGSRSIDPGTAVRALRRTGHRGHDEAVRVESVS